MKNNTFSIEVQLNLTFDEANKRVIEALKTEGFGVLTEIDVKSTLKSKLGEDFRPYRILGACNPPLAYKALSNMPEIGLLLPCNVTVEEALTGGSIISFLNPEFMLSVGNLSENEQLIEVASEAFQKLERVAQSLT